jgi:hypothetical protein
MPHKRKSSKARWKALRSGLRPAPYSDTSLVDSSDPFFHLQPYKKGFIVTDRGVQIGSIQKTKRGWDKGGYHSLGSHGDLALDRAIRLIDENVEY